MVTKVKFGYEKYLFIDYSSRILGDFKPISPISSQLSPSRIAFSHF